MGLLGDGFQDPRSAAIMALAGNMVRGGLNGGFGGGLLAAQDAYQSTANSELERQSVRQQMEQRDLQIQQARQEWALQQPVLARYMARLNANGGGAPGAPATPDNSQPPIASTSGGPLGSGTFGIPVGGQQGSSAPQQNAPTQGAPSGGGTAFPGVPDNLADATIAFGGLRAIPGLLEKFNTPTDVLKNAAEAYGVGTPEYRQAVRGAVDKAGTTPLRPSAPYIRNGTLYGSPAQAPAGFMNQPNPDGTWSTVPVQNGPQAVAASNAAGAAGTALGKTAGTPQTVFNSGTGQPGMSINPFGVQVPGMPQFGGTGANGQPNSFVPTGPMQGSDKIVDANAGNFVSTQQAVPRVLNSMEGDKNALDLVNKGTFVTGNGSDKKYDWAALAQTWKIPIAKGETADYQLAHKYLANSLSQTANDMGMNGSDARFAAAAQGNPNIETQGPTALADSIRWVAGLKSGVPAYAQAQQQWMAAHNNSPASLQQFQQTWNKAYDPNVFVTRWLQQRYGNDAAHEWIVEHKLDPKQLAQSYSQLHSIGAF